MNVLLLISYFERFFDLLKINMLLFFLLIVICNILQYDSVFYIVRFKLFLLELFFPMSSAYMQGEKSNSSLGISRSIYLLNNYGLRIPPYSTPLRIGMTC